MSELFEDPPRWREHADQSNLTERAFGQALRAMVTPPPLSGPQMARLAAGLRPSRAQRSRAWIAVGAAFILGLATAASAAHLSILPRWLMGPASPPLPAVTPAPRAHGSRSLSRPTSAVAATEAFQLDSIRVAPTQAPPAIIGFPPSTSRAGERPARPVPAAPTSLPGPLPEPAAAARLADSHASLASPQAASSAIADPAAFLPAPAVERLGGTAPARAAHTAMLEPPVNPASSKVVAREPAALGEPGAAKLLVDAIRALRVDGSPESALALLDRHATLLSKSPYGHEALLVRVDALLALKREGELLRLLDGSALADGAASRTLLVTRGKLRAAANRCADAVSDFDRVLAEAGRADVQALLGRASCREKLGDGAGARADRARYRWDFPSAP